MSLKKRSKKAPSNVPKPTITFHDVARTIAGPNAPSWLAPFLEWLSQGSVYDRLFQKQLPTRTIIRNRLREIVKAAATLQSNLRDPNVVRFLKAVKPNWMAPNPGLALKDLSERAAVACALPRLSKGDGTVSRGRGKAMAPGALSPKDVCAAIIAELWKHFRRRYPGSRNLQAATAAENFWVASGGKWTTGIDPIETWRPHFVSVKLNESSAHLQTVRTKLQVDLRQAERSGRSPWFVGVSN
jgi:hypothetical protein